MTKKLAQLDTRVVIPEWGGGGYPPNQVNGTSTERGSLSRSGYEKYNPRSCYLPHLKLIPNLNFYQTKITDLLSFLKREYKLFLTK